MTTQKLKFDKNLERIESLCNTYHFLKTDEIKERGNSKFTDILRAAVVLLHSSFEEYYRNIIRDLLPKRCDKNDLKNIPFFNSERAKKISLDKLLDYNDCSVNDVINHSISEELDYTSFNKFSDIKKWADKAKIDLSTFEERSSLDILIQRRHKIVHEADNSRDDSGYRLSKIQESNVREWILIVCKLVDVIENAIEE